MCYWNVLFHLTINKIPIGMTLFLLLEVFECGSHGPDGIFCSIHWMWNSWSWHLFLIWCIWTQIPWAWPLGFLQYSWWQVTWAWLVSLFNPFYWADDVCILIIVNWLLDESCAFEHESHGPVRIFVWNTSEHELHGPDHGQTTHKQELFCKKVAVFCMLTWWLNESANQESCKFWQQWLVIEPYNIHFLTKWTVYLVNYQTEQFVMVFRRVKRERKL